MFYVYCLESKKNQELYFGYTNDLKRRVKEHNDGLNLSTKKYIPLTLIYYEACMSEKDAIRREKYLKKTQGQRMLKLRLKDYFFGKRKV